LFGNSDATRVHSTPGFWSGEEKLGEEDIQILVEYFSEKEVALAIAGMKTESALGLNGFIVTFFK
jgi:hypothetical protein